MRTVIGIYLKTVIIFIGLLPCLFFHHLAYNAVLLEEDHLYHREIRVVIISALHRWDQLYSMLKIHCVS